MNDLISRQAAIAKIANLPDVYWAEEACVDKGSAVEALLRLPSAQPALDEWCTDCKEYDQERHCCPRWNMVIRTALDDAIHLQKEQAYMQGYEDARKELPSVQPEIIMCKDCRWQKDQSGSTAWLPCMALVTPSDFYCGRAERRTDGN